MPVNEYSCELKLKSSAFALQVKYPFHARILDQWILVRAPEIGTMGVGASRGMLRLYWAPDFVRGLTEPSLVEVLHHEINHVIFRHLSLDEALFPDPTALLVAEEVTVNEFVDTRYLPAGAILLEDFPFLTPLQSTLERYALLEFRAEVEPFRGRSSLHGIWQKELGPGEVEDILDELVDHALIMLPEHLLSSVPKGIIDAIRKRRESLWRSAGSVSGSMEARLVWEPGAMDWKRILRGLRGDALDSDFRLSRPSRRIPDEKFILPVRSRCAVKPRVMAVVDTSGSIADEELAEITGELEKLALDFEVTIVECDYAIKRVYPLSQNGLGSFIGRGGTSFLPPFEKTFLRRQDPAVVLYFTDGEGEAPSTPPPLPVFWVLTKYGSRPASWGSEIRMGREGK